MHTIKIARSASATYAATANWTSGSTVDCESRSVNSKCRGFTIVELLVSIGLIGVLLSLTAPAVMNAVEQARKTRCSNNLRQFGVAMNAVEAQFKAFPPVRDEQLIMDQTANTPIGRGFRLQTSPHISLLGPLGLTTIADQLRIQDDDFGYGDPMSSGLNSNLLTVRIPVFLCPSVDSSPGVTTYFMSNGTCPSNARIDSGDVRTSALRGVFSTGKGRRASEIVDGLSNTVAFSERITGDRDHTNYSPWRDIAAFGGEVTPLPDVVKTKCENLGSPIHKHLSFAGVGWLFGELGVTCYNHILPPNSKTPDCTQSGTTFGGPSVITARSLHDGGVFCLLVDGSVSFISEGIDVYVWRAMGTIDGGELQ